MSLALTLSLFHAHTLTYTHAHTFSQYKENPTHGLCVRTYIVPVHVSLSLSLSLSLCHTHTHTHTQGSTRARMLGKGFEHSFNPPALCKLGTLPDCCRRRARVGEGECIKYVSACVLVSRHARTHIHVHKRTQTKLTYPCICKSSRRELPRAGARLQGCPRVGLWGDIKLKSMNLAHSTITHMHHTHTHTHTRTHTHAHAHTHPALSLSCAGGR